VTNRTSLNHAAAGRQVQLAALPSPRWGEGSGVRGGTSSTRRVFPPPPPPLPPPGGGGGKGASAPPPAGGAAGGKHNRPANAAANKGASVDTEPSINPANPGWTTCNKNKRCRVAASSSSAPERARALSSSSAR